MTTSPMLPDATRWHRDDEAGFAVPVPEDWQVLPGPDSADGPASTGVLAAVEPDGPTARAVGFRANLVVTRDEVDASLDLKTWQRGTDVVLDQQLSGWVLLDLEWVEVSGRLGARRLGTYVTEQGAALTLEQWTTLRDGVGHTLSVTAANDAWDDLADEVAALAAAFTLAHDDGSAGGHP